MQCPTNQTWSNRGAQVGPRSPANEKVIMEDHYKLVDKAVPKRPLFYHLDQELEDNTGRSRSSWKKGIDAGEVRVIQRATKRSGSRIVIPRSEVVRVLAGMVR